MPRIVPLEHPWVNAERAPLYQLTFPRETTDEELVKFCEARERWAELAQYPVAWVVDLAGIMSATARQRRLFSQHLERFEHHDIAYNRGSALVVPNAVVRGMVTAVFWLKQPRFPNECFPTRVAAISWALEQLAKDSPGAGAEAAVNPRKLR